MFMTYFNFITTAATKQATNTNVFQCQCQYNCVDNYVNSASPLDRSDAIGELVLCEQKQLRWCSGCGQGLEAVP